MKIQLLSGSFVQSKLSAGDSSNKKFVDKDCMLVYEGAFESMDGPVEVTGDHIEKLFAKYVERMGTAKLASGEPDMRKCAPIQLDHSTAATHTVGRLIGMNSVGEHEGKKALFGRVRILGAENVEKVEDGRWTHVSIGADLEDGEISELTITPFPAAANASLLKAKMSRLKKFDYKGRKVTTFKGPDGYGYAVQDPNDRWMDVDGFDSEDEAVKDAKAAIDEADKDSKMSRLGWRNIHTDTYDGVRFQIQTDEKYYYVLIAEISNTKHGPYKDIMAAKKAAHDMIDDDAPFRMSKLAANEDMSYRGVDFTVYVKEAMESGANKSTFVSQYHIYEDNVKGNWIMGNRDQSTAYQKALGQARDAIDKILAGRKKKLSEGDSMNKEKMKKYLMEEKKMSEKEADKHLKKLEKDEAGSAALSAEMDEHEKKMSAAEADPTKMSEEADPTKMSEEDKEKEKLSEEKPKDEEEKEKLSAEADPTKMSDEEDEEKKKLSEDEKKKEDEEKLSGEADPTKMSAMKSKIIALAGKIKTSNTKIQLEAKKAKLSARLSSLRKEGKISPAELKCFNIDEMASLDDKSADVMFNTLSKLSKRIDFEFKGTVEAEDISQVSAVSKQLRLKRLEIETRLNMPSKAKKAKEELKALIEEEKHLAKKMGETEIHIDTTPHEHNDIHASADEEMSKMCALMDEGKKDDFKKALKSFMDRCRAKHMTTGESDEKRMSSIAKDIQTLQNDYKELVSLVGESFGVKSEDLI